MAVKTFASVLCFALIASACGQPARTATNFCRQLAKEAPGITQPTVTSADIATMLDRYKRLGEVSPLAIQNTRNHPTNSYFSRYCHNA
ncbi:MAG: hypothetical protein NTY54_06810 [Actinobacteria bacterium]|nr:hypothetical protein [Actinomycetota bacterium]